MFSGEWKYHNETGRCKIHVTREAGNFHITRMLLACSQIDSGDTTTRYRMTKHWENLSSRYLSQIKWCWLTLWWHCQLISFTVLIEETFRGPIHSDKDKVLYPKTQLWPKATSSIELCRDPSIPPSQLDQVGRRTVQEDAPNRLWVTYKPQKQEFKRLSNLHASVVATGVVKQTATIPDRPGAGGWSSLCRHNTAN